MLQAKEDSDQSRGSLEILRRILWLAAYYFEPGVGYHLEWTILGHQRAMLLKHIVDKHGFAGHSERFTKFAADCEAAKAARLKSELLEPEIEFWLLCMRELKLEDTRQFMPLMEVFALWQPRNPDEFLQDTTG